MMRCFLALLTACLLYSGPCVASVERVLSDADVKTYKTVFDQHKKGEITKAKNSSAKIQNNLLMGYVLYDRYFLKSYKTKQNEISEWLSKYGSLPVANEIYALGKQKKADLPKQKPIDVFGSKTAACTFVARQEPIDLIRYRQFSRYSADKKKKAKNLMNGVARNLSKGRTLNARQLIESAAAKKLFNREEMNAAKTALGFSYFLDGQDEKALTFATEAMSVFSADIPQAAWTAGLVSWRQGNMEQSAQYFERAVEAEQSYPLLHVASAFWAARANIRLGRFERAGNYLDFASEYPRTFYGFLAMRLLQLDLAHAWEKPATGTDDVNIDVTDVVQSDSMQRFYALLQIGQTEWAKRELAAAYVTADKENKAVLFMLATKQGMEDDLLALAGHLEGNEDTRYPAPKWTPLDGWKADKALVYAFVKQESCFNRYAQSSVGALGLMQIMPKTGRELAKQLSYKFSTHKLKDAAYNLSLGQNYLLKLLENPEVNNNLIFTAVAYNAGPGNLTKWKGKMNYQNDPLLFIESIPSKETRSFVERILVNYWVYRALMGQSLESLDYVAGGSWPIYHPKDK